MMEIKIPKGTKRYVRPRADNTFEHADSIEGPWSCADARACIEFTLPIKTVNPTNNRQHWRTVWARSKKERLTARKGAWAYRISGGIDLPAIVTITRISPGTLDDDNLRPALKSIRDGVADAFSVADNDRRIEWRYQQERCAPKRYGVRIRIEAKGDA